MQAVAPKRTREHELEDESRVKLASSLPSEWVVRSMEKDYGIDTEVEIFVQGEPTGLVFKAQLKGTESLRGRPPHRSIKVSHLKYWASLDVPVLIVLYVADSGEQYVKWSFAHDPGIRGYSQKTTTVHFVDSDKLSDRVAELQSEVQMHRALAAGHIPIPVPIEVEGRGITPAARYTFLQNFRQRITELGLEDLVQVTSRMIEPALVLTLDVKVCRLAMPLNAGSMSIHANRGEKFDLSDAQAIDMALILVASMLSTRGETTRALRICERVGPNHSWFLPEVARRFCGVFDTEGRYDIGMAIARYLLSEADSLHDLALAALYIEPAQSHSREMPEDDFIELLDLLGEASSRFREIGDGGSAIVVCFNAANACTRRPDYGRAIDFLERAGEIDSNLIEQEFYQLLLAGCAFRGGKFLVAAHNYQLLVDAGERGSRLLANYGDALLFSGSYAGALAIYEGKYGGPLDDRLSVVNAMACREIVTVTGLETQIPRDLSDEEIDLVESDPSVAIELLRSANALEFMLWYQLEPQAEAWSLQRSCLLARLNPEAGPIWIVATHLAAMEFGLHHGVSRAILEMAVVSVGETFLELLRELQAEYGDDSGAAEISELAHEMALDSVVSDEFVQFDFTPVFEHEFGGALQSRPGWGARRR